MIATLAGFSPNNDEWNAALIGYHDAWAAFADYSAEHDWTDGPGYEELLDVRTAAEFKLSSTPAPDAKALLWKIGHTKQMADEMGDWPDGWWDDAMADLVRFLEERT